MAQQLTLNVHLNDEATLENFFCPAPVTESESSRAQAVEAIRAQLTDQGEQYLFIWGGEGSGRSHILQAGCHHTADNGLACQYLPLKDFVDFEPESLLDSLEQIPLVCLDDIDSVLGQNNWDEALFHFFNRIKSSENKLIIAANDAPNRLQCKLPDLLSRLSWGPVFHFGHYTDEDKQDILQHRASNRGLQLSSESAQFILQHNSRDMENIMSTLDKLDQSSLVNKRRLTIPFIKEALASP